MLRLPDLLDRDKERLGADATAERSLIENVLLADRLLQDSSTPTASSGSTCLLAYLRGPTIYIASVGDTRAVLGCRTAAERGKWRARGLTTDHRPDEPAERLRLQKHGATVLKPEGGAAARIWCSGGGGGSLSLSRAVGDHAARRFGVICRPDVIRHDLRAEDQLLILASDGVWEYISDVEAVRRDAYRPPPPRTPLNSLPAAPFR